MKNVCPLNYTPMPITKKKFGQLKNGETVHLFTMKNKKGLTAKVISYGGILTELWTPDKNGKLINIVLGYQKLENYLKYSPYFGATVGRYANRIAKGRFKLAGKPYRLATNNPPNHLHGGPTGLALQNWKAKTIQTTNGSALALTCFSPDGAEGFPGNLTTTVTYCLTDENKLKIQYHAVTDQLTVVNFSHHSYFNLSGKDSVLDHVLQIKSDRITPTDKTLIPTGNYLHVQNTPFDFRKPTALSARILESHPQLKNGGGYDHNWVLSDWNNQLRSVASLHDLESGRMIKVSTTEPGLQIYTGNFLEGTPTEKKGVKLKNYQAVCLETQHFPDSPNHGHFPTTVLKAGEEFKSETIYGFEVVY